MYRVDDSDLVIELDDIPQSSVGAPIPVVLAGEHSVGVFFYAENAPGEWDGTSVRIVGPERCNENCVIVKFQRCYAHMFGPPNDEAFSGHPLHGRGLRPYANFEVKNSSWLRGLERMNSVHPYHDKQRFVAEKAHYVLAFHDSTFECIATSYSFESTQRSISEALKDVGPKIIT